MKQNKPFSRFYQNIENSLRDGYAGVRRYNYTYPCSLSMKTLSLLHEVSFFSLNKISVNTYLVGLNSQMSQTVHNRQSA